MSYLTTGKINTLRIQPLTTHQGKSGRRTTITAFHQVLQTEENDKHDSTSVGKTNRRDTGTSYSGVSFRDPITGKQVRYIEADGNSDAASASKQTAGTDASRATSASSMKKTKYDAYFKKAAEKYGVSESLLKGIAKAESNFNARDLSSSGAMGVMQLMPETARSLGVSDPYDPEQNIMGGAKCIAQKLKEFNGDVELALAAYNAGSGAVKRAGGIPSKCRTYIKKVLSYQEAFETAKKVG